MPIQTAEEYRQEACKLLYDCKENKSIAELHKLFADKYQIAKAQLYGDKTKDVLDGIRKGLFILAVGLFACGIVDVVYDILDNIPTRNPLSKGARVIQVLTPLPENLNPFSDTDKVKDWFQKHHDDLVWNSENEKYEFK